MRVGVVAVQGAVSEHITSIERALSTLGIDGEPVRVLTVEELMDVDGVIIPGGESTSISKLMLKNHLFEPLVERAEDGMPVMGTCAGCVLMGKVGDAEVEKTGTRLLGLMDMAVDRNAFGRQRESFEAPLQVKSLGREFPAVFIRAPMIREAWGDCIIEAELDENIVMARQGSRFAVAFHPELTLDTGVHELFLVAVKTSLASRT